MTTLTQKEQTLLEDAKSHEELCVEKYNKHSSCAKDPQLQNLFKTLAGKEQQHLDSINQILSGTVPSVNAGGSSTSQSGGSQQPASYHGLAGEDKQHDAYLCGDVLSTEKYVSSTYNTAIFEFKDTNIRNVLNHIQKEEQEHGEQIYNYMAANGMYN